MAADARRLVLPALPAVAVLGFASGLPLSLTDSTLKAWLSGAGVDIKLIGLLGLVGMPYSLKFLWSPLLDRFAPPFGGRRRGWILLVELALMGGLIGMAYSDPKISLLTLCLLALAVAFFSATADIAIDAYRTELLPEQQASMGAGLHVGAYRVAMLAAGAFALWLSDRASWRVVYLVMAGLLVPGILGAWWAPEPANARVPSTLRQAVVEPFRDLVRRQSAWQVLVFVAVFKLGDMFTSTLTVPFLKELGFSNTDIGLATKGVGLGCLITGGLVGGVLMRRWTLERALWTFGLIQAAANLLPFLLARAGHVHPLMLAVIGGENLCWGLGTTAYTTLLMRLCDRRNTATQYAVLSSLMALSRTVFASPAGWVKAAAGWPGYFLFAASLALPGLLLLRGFSRWQLPETDPSSDLSRNS
jgi:PAT family beta-lactamase induction signal transducer AmpG